MTRGFTLAELLVSSAILGLFAGMVAWFGKGVTDHRTRSEQRLKLLDNMQRVLFSIENDFLSARRYTIGNLLCNNILFTPYGGTLQRTTSDPGFDSEYARFTNNPAVRDQWYCPTPALVPATISAGSDSRRAFVDQTVAGRWHGTGSLAVQSDSANGTYYSVRSPDFSELKNQDYVLAGWVRGDTDGNAFLVPELSFQAPNGDGSPANDIKMVSQDPDQPTFGNWTYLAALIPSNLVAPNQTYNVYLRTQVKKANPTRALTAHFDSITVTPESVIARIDFNAARAVSMSGWDVNLHALNHLGTVFFLSDPANGRLLERKFIFGNGDGKSFPPSKPILLRYSAPVPYINPVWYSTNGVKWTGSIKESSLPNISSLEIAWVGDWKSGSNRPLQITTTVLDPDDWNKTISIARNLTPPTD